jgi:hypothetical protein
LLLDLLTIPYIVCLKNTMGKTTTKQQTHFPGDPRYGIRLSPLPQDVKALGDRAMLITRLLDCLIQRAAAPPPADEISSDKKKSYCKEFIS